LLLPFGLDSDDDLEQEHRHSEKPITMLHPIHDPFLSGWNSLTMVASINHVDLNHRNTTAGISREEIFRL
jgi:hypothetical protein